MSREEGCRAPPHLLRTSLYPTPVHCHDCYELAERLTRADRLLKLQEREHWLQEDRAAAERLHRESALLLGERELALEKARWRFECEKLAAREERCD